MNRNDAIITYKKIMPFCENLSLTCVDVSAIKNLYEKAPVYELRVTGQEVNQKLKEIVETIQQNLTITQTNESLVII